MPFSACRSLLVSVGDLADKLDPCHVHGPVNPRDGSLGSLCGRSRRSGRNARNHLALLTLISRESFSGFEPSGSV
jgi:hypothetical protein